MMTNGKIQLSPMLRVAMFLVAGIIAGDGLYGVVPLWAWYALLVVSVVVAAMLRRRCLPQSLMIFVSVALLGGSLTSYERSKAEVSLPEKKVRWQAVVAGRPQVSGKVVRCDIIITGMGRPLKVKASIHRDRRADMVRVGDGISGVSRLEPPANYAESRFDYRRWLLRHGYVATTYVYVTNWRGAAVDLTSLSYTERTRLAALRLRDRLLSRYEALDFEDNGYAVLAAMTLGDKSSLPAGVKNDYSVSGASHVLALSGLHLGIIYAVLVLMFSRLRRRELVMPLVVCAIWTYVFIVGMPVSAVRSAIMLTVYSFVSMLNRDRMSLNALAVAAVVILVSNPLDFYDVGFQMSFMAVMSILVFYRPLCRLMPWKLLSVYPVKWLWQLMAVSVAAQIGVAPLVAFYFNQFSCYFLLTNIMVVPAATLILYGALLMLPLGVVPSLQSAFAGCLAAIVSLLNSGVSFVASLPGASISGININLLQLLSIYVVIASAYLIVKKMRGLF